MRRKKRKRQVDEQLLGAIFTVEREWKRVQSIVEQSIEPTIDGQNRVAIAQAKYMFLLREAKRRQINALRYGQS
ncbi:MAG TPA: YaaL family protein [Cerasibacillus sp.]|uniref:YaaL family protein n=1 Tax=Cerasibacillus sp. TaxID=2498711 RepID=UPI002F421331